MPSYRYTECGLDNVLIEQLNFLQDDAGEQCIHVPNVNGLHKAIACGIVRRESGMTGRELRFIRTEIGMTQAQMAEFVHREPLAISRWERGEGVIDSNAEALIRLHAVEKLELGDDHLTVAQIAGWCVPSAVRAPIVIDGSDPEEYRLMAA